MKLYREYGANYIGTDEYYERIDKTIRKRFPEAFSDTEIEVPESTKKTKQKPSTIVASAKRSTAPKKVKLTDTQLAIAKKFRITPEQYAREYLRLQENV